MWNDTLSIKIIITSENVNLKKNLLQRLAQFYFVNNFNN